MNRKRTAKKDKATKGQTRVAIYVRVSSEEQVEGFSLDAQERALEAYCREQNHEIVARFRDEGKSARSDDLSKRPGFSAMLDAAEAGDFDVLVVHKLDRFARNLRLTLETLDRLEAAGVGFISISENMDFSTPMGRVVLSTMGGLAQFYSDNLSNETKKGKHERKAQGLYNGLLPFGATKGPDGVPIPNSETHPGLLLAFSLAAAGKTDCEVAQALNEAGYRTSGNRGSNPFSKDSVRPMLQNRFYLGELPDGNGGWIPGKHERLIDEDLFLQAQVARVRNTSRPRRMKTAQRSPWALSGVATCVCGASMVASGSLASRHRVQCARRAQSGDCDAPSFYSDLVDEQIGVFLKRFQIPDSERALLVEAWQSQQPVGRTVGRDRERIQRKLDRLRETYLEGDLDSTEYRRRKKVLTEELTVLPEGTAPTKELGEYLAQYLADISSAWEVATPEEKNRLARQLFSSVLIENRTAVEVTPRPDLLPFFATVSNVIWEGRKRRGMATR